MWVFNANQISMCLDPEVGAPLTGLNPPVKYFTDRSKAVLLLWIFYGFFMPPKELWEAYSNRTVRPSVSPSARPSVRPSVPLSCPVHISYILWGRNFKFGVWIHLGMAECRVPFSGHCDLDLDL